jgi:hypothetical protein
MNAHRHPRRLLILASCLLVLTAYAQDESPEAWGTYLDLTTADGILEVYFENHPSGVTLPETLPMDQFAEKLPEPYRSRLPLHDGWGHPLMVAEAEGDLLFVSAGENGKHEIIENLAVLTSNDPYLGEEAELYGDDIFLVEGKRVEEGPRTLANRQEITMRLLLTVAEEVEESDEGHDCSRFGQEGQQDSHTAERRLAPLYLYSYPMNDPWKHPLLYWCDREGYMILSTGADGVLDAVWNESRPDQVQLAGEISDPDADIVFSNGFFLQWPKTRHSAELLRTYP